jgi:membrane fusion protein (multidrug efflux system)
MSPPDTEPYAAATPPALDEQDAVPRLRADLHISPSDTPGVVQVGNGAGGRTFTLRDFEMSIARMLDGQRKAGETVEAARQIGIPLSIDSLRHFIARLRTLGFIEEGEGRPPPPPGSPPERLTWPPRSEWTEDERRLYQQALKLFREDKFKDAKGVLDQMLAKRAFAAEALDLRARIDKAIRGGPATGSFTRDFNMAEATWFATGEAESRKAADQIAALADLEDTPSAARGRGIWLIALLVVLVGAVLGVPLPHEMAFEVRLVPSKESNLVAPHAGTLEAVAVTEGQDVKAGDVVARYDVLEVKKRLEKVDASISDLQRQIRRLQAAASSPRIAKLKGQQAKREAQLAKATTDRDRLAAKGRRSAALAKAEKQLAGLKAAVQKGAAEIDALPGAKAIPALQDQVKAKQPEREALAALAKEAPAIAATEGGTLVGLTMKGGQKVAANDTLGRVADLATLRAVAEVPPGDRKDVRVGQQLAFEVSGLAFSANVASIKGDSGELTAMIPNASRKLKAGATGSARLRAGSRSLLGRLLH